MDVCNSSLLSEEEGEEFFSSKIFLCSHSSTDNYLNKKKRLNIIIKTANGIENNYTQLLPA